MAIIKGIRVVLIDKIEVSTDAFGSPIFENVEIPIDNVLVVPANSDDVINQLNLKGKKADYLLGIPKGDNNIWENREVLIFGKRWRTVGMALEGMEHQIPLDWNKKIGVERFE